MKRRFTLLLASLFALLALALTCAFATPARAEEYDDPDADNAILAEDTGFESVSIPDTDYQGGTIPRMDITFRDTVDPETGEPLTGDEVIDLVNTSANHSYKATEVSVSITVPADYDNPEADMWDGVSGYTGETDLELEFIRGRGNSTWRQPKKPYKLKFDSKVDLFGMGKNKHWALIANFYDQSLSLDRLIGWLGDSLGTLGFSPRGVPVDLFMNGKYYGSYVLMEEVRVDSNRVDIDEVDEGASDLGSLAITGDYLIGVARKPTALPYEYFLTSRGHAFTYDTPEYETDLTAAQQAQQQYLKQHFDRVEDAIYTRDLVSPSGESAWDFIDMQTLADYWWIQEFTTNVDGFATPSTYTYKLQDTVAADGSVTVGKLYWGPLWDFDFVWGQIYEEGFENVQAEWVWYLRQDPEFVALLKERWAVLDSKLDEITRAGGILDGYLAEMQASWDANHELWEVESAGDWDHSSLTGAIESMRSAIEARRAWINGHLDELQTRYCELTFINNGEQVDSVLIRANTSAYHQPPEYSDTDEWLFDGWFTADGKEYIPEDHVTQDETFYAVWSEVSTATRGEEIYVPQSEIWLQWSSDIIFEVLPMNARDKRVEWTSSDESVVRVSGQYLIAGNPEFDENGLAEAIVTGRLVNSGAEVSIKVVVYNNTAEKLSDPESITFDDEVSVAVGEDAPLRFVAEPEPNSMDESFPLSFTSEDESIAAVTLVTGVVTGVAPGTTTINVWKINTETWEEELIDQITVTVGEPAPETFAITFELAGGTIDGNAGPIVMQCEKGEVITLPAAPVRDGYTFVCWRGSEYQPGDEYTVEDDHTFTAEWEKNAEPEPGGDVTPAPTPSGGGGQGGGGQGGQGNGRGGGNTPRTGEAAAPVVALLAAAAIACTAGALLRRRTRA